MYEQYPSFTGISNGIAKAASLHQMVHLTTWKMIIFDDGLLWLLTPQEGHQQAHCYLLIAAVATAALGCIFLCCFAFFVFITGMGKAQVNQIFVGNNVLPDTLERVDMKQPAKKECV